MNKTKMILRELAKGPASNEEIAARVGCTRAMVSYVRCNVQQKKGDTIVGIFTDMHEPACHPRFFDFVCDTFKQFNVNEICCLGDVIDHHFISRHTSETDSLSPTEELRKAIQNLKKWGKKFPNVKCCYGNHDMIPARRLQELGMPKDYLRPLNELYELPDGWKWENYWEIDGVRYEHGLSATGFQGAKTQAMAYQQSVVVGHSHSFGGVLYAASPNSMVFGMNCGCGMDVESYAARYGERYKFKPTLGCGIVINGKHGIFVPMDMEKYSRHVK